MYYVPKACRVIALAIAAASVSAADAATARFHHTFDGPADASGTYTGTLHDGAILEKIGDEGVVTLGATGYFDFGSKVGAIIKDLSADYTITAMVFIPSSTTLGANGNFIFNFGNSSSTGYLFFGANESRYSISTTNWSGEQTTKVGSQFPKGEWVSIAVVQKGNTNSIYFNGELKKSAEISLRPSALGATTQNWLGRSPYNGDILLRDARYADFRIYDSALTDAEVLEAADLTTLAALNGSAVGDAIDSAIADMAFDFSDVRGDVTLPTVLGQGITGSWATSDASLISAAGRVTRPAAGASDASLTLTLTATRSGVSRTFDYPATVRAMLSDADAARADADAIVLPPNKDNLRSFIALPGSTLEGSTITWESSDPSWLTSSGRVRRLSDTGAEKHEVILTANVSRGKATVSRDFTVHIANREDYDSYLFVYFPSNSNENLYYALSSDGYKYTALNHGKRVMHSDTVALKKGIRDPHILRGPDGCFYMVATDMKSSEGWSSNRGMVLYKSKDLVNWTHSTVHFPDRFPEWKNVTRVWAPETIWDPDYENADGTRGRFLIYYSLLTNDGKCPYDKVYYSYANDDFTDLMTEPEYFYDRGSATIDCDIVFNEADGKYHMFYKNEGSGGICKVVASRLTPVAGQPAGSQWSNPSAQLQQTTEAVEGAGVFRLINSDSWVLMYDCYMNGHYQFCTSDDLENFRLTAQTNTSGAFTPRHGTVIALHPEETARLLEVFPADMPAPAITGALSPAVRTDGVTITADRVHLPVYPGTDLGSFDPMLAVTAGCTVSPEGEQDFTAGAVKYTVSDGSASAVIEVSADVEANPVLPGFNADPEVLYSRKTGRFYIYPTTDGISGWGGHTFNVWSSADLVNWHKETCILDLATNDVTWATGNAWAPAIEEKQLPDGSYRYYFYFSGHNPDKNYKTLGCAVSDSPTGPFRDLGRPLVDENITSGQLIDSDVFTDPVSGNTYFYWGNGNLVASKLADDMTTISDATVITPQGGNTATYAFREGVYVFYRQGKYYFMWSVDDTGARNYHVAYGTSDSPMGPITVAENPVILLQSSADRIYGTGHNSVIQIPDSDVWYIVYHRINADFVNNGGGYHREVCIDRLEFNADGTIKPVTPTRRGIDPVDPKNPSGVENVIADSADTDGTVVSTMYYHLSGAMLGTTAPTQTGLYIRQDRLSSGRTRAEKIVVR